MYPFITLYSNRIEVLYSQLIEKLKFSLLNSPFKKRLIITPGPWVKTWLMEKIAKEPEIGTTLGLTLLSIEEAIPYLRKELLLSTHKKIPSLMELTCLIEGALEEIVDPSLIHWIGNHPKKRRHLAEKTAFLSKNMENLHPDV